MHLLISFFVTDFVRKNSNDATTFGCVKNIAGTEKRLVTSIFSISYNAFNPFLHIYSFEFIKEKSLWKKVKLLKMSNFTFSHNIFYATCILKSFNPFPNKPWFLRVYRTSPLKTLWEEEKLLVTSNFSFSHGVFYPFGELSAIFIKFEIVVCKFFEFGRVQNL